MIVSNVTRVSLLWTFDEPRWLCEANEVISLSMDNIWRSTQLFYISAPLLLYSIIKGGVVSCLLHSWIVKAYYCTLRAFVFFLIKVQWFSWCSASRSIVSEAVYLGVRCFFAVIRASCRSRVALVISIGHCSNAQASKTTCGTRCMVKTSAFGLVVTVARCPPTL